MIFKSSIQTCSALADLAALTSAPGEVALRASFTVALSVSFMLPRRAGLGWVFAWDSKCALSASGVGKPCMHSGHVNAAAITFSAGEWARRGGGACDGGGGMSNVWPNFRESFRAGRLRLAL